MLAKGLIAQIERHYAPESLVACILWNQSDIATICEQYNIQGLTTNNMDNILDSVHKQRNPETGINWDIILNVIQCYIITQNGD